MREASASAIHNHWRKPIESNDANHVSIVHDAFVNLNFSNVTALKGVTHMLSKELNIRLLLVPRYVRANNRDFWVLAKATKEEFSSLDKRNDLT